MNVNSRQIPLIKSLRVEYLMSVEEGLKERVVRIEKLGLKESVIN